MYPAVQSPGISGPITSAANRALVPWLALAVVLGAVVGLLVSVTGGTALSVIAAASALLLAVSVVLRDMRTGLYLILLALPLETAGRLITEPVVVTAYQLALLFALAVWGIKTLREEDLPRFEFSTLHLGVVLLVVGAAWSLPLSLAPSETLLAVIRLLFLTLFFVLFATHVDDERTMSRVLAVFVITAVASAVLALLQYRFPELNTGVVRVVGIGDAKIPRVSAFFEDPNYLAGMLSLALVVALARIVHARSVTHAVPWVVAIGVTGVGLFLTLSRTGLVAIAVGILACVATAPRARRAVLVAVLAAVVAAAVLYAPGTIVERVASISDIEGDASVATRYYMYGSTIEMIGDYWVFGTGLAAYDQAYPDYMRAGALPRITRPHQIPLSLPAETGVVGLLAELVIVLGVFGMVVRRRRRSWSPWESAAVVGLLTLLVQTLFQYYLYFEYLWLFLALTVAADRLARTTEEV
jgi:O-antigen ligase